MYSGLYINELLLRVVAHETDYSPLFYDYLHYLQWLAGATGSPEPVDDAMTYHYREEKGFIASVLLDRYSFTRRELRALAAREFPDIDMLRAAKRFTRMALKPYLGGKSLKSRELFRQFLDRRPAGAGCGSAGGHRVSNKLACATALVYTATQYRQKSGEGDV